MSRCGAFVLLMICACSDGERLSGDAALTFDGQPVTLAYGTAHVRDGWVSFELGSAPIDCGTNWNNTDVCSDDPPDGYFAWFDVADVAPGTTHALTVSLLHRVDRGCQNHEQSVAADVTILAVDDEAMTVRVGSAADSGDDSLSGEFRLTACR